MIHLTSENFAMEAENCLATVVVMFYASWCGKCAMMKPIVEDISKKYSYKIKFCEVDVSESKALAEKYEADIVPTFVMFKDGGIESYMTGLIDSKVLEERIRELL